MNTLGLLFFVVVATALLAVPRRWAPVPLLVGCCYMTVGQGLELGPVSLPMIRMLLAVGLLRVVARGEKAVGAPNTIDWLMLGFIGWIMFASFFHDGYESGPLTSAGIVFNIGLVYYLMRVFCRTTEELVGLVKVIAIMLVPVALEMIQEKYTGKNVFAMLFGGVSEDVVLRNEKLRARGPFRHAILAGTVGAACFPLMYAIRQRAPLIAKIGMVTTLFMVFASASSGPLMSLIFAVLAMAAWRFRAWTGYVPAAAIGLYIALDLVMKQPAYYIISRIDLTGGSTGWHRSRLIDAAISNLSEWWLFGTDFTRHWMPTGITYSQRHTDITNYYLGFGVTGGLLAIIFMVAAMGVAFRWVAQGAKTRKDQLNRGDRFLIWCLGAGLFSHAMTSLSVAYYDQSFVFFWFNLAVISSIHSVLQRDRARALRASRRATTAPPRDRPSPAPTVPEPVPSPSGVAR